MSAGGRGEEASERGSAASGVVYTNTLWRVINWEFTTRHFPPIVAAVGPSAALTRCITVPFGVEVLYRDSQPSLFHSQSLLLGESPWDSLILIRISLFQSPKRDRN